MRQKIYIALSIMALTLSSGLCAQSSQLSPSQSVLKEYHDSGQYYHDISSIIKKATYYLQFRIIQNQRISHHRKLAIVMNIDETALSNYKDLLHNDFSINKNVLHLIEKKAHANPIPFTLALFNYAKNHNVAVFFVTSREPSLHINTVANLSHTGYQDWRLIYYKPNSYHNPSTEPYYRMKRKLLTKQGFDIIMNIGNEQRSLNGGYSDSTFKLPNPFYHLS